MNLQRPLIALSGVTLKWSEDSSVEKKRRANGGAVGSDCSRGAKYLPGTCSEELSGLGGETGGFPVARSKR